MQLVARRLSGPDVRIKVWTTRKSGEMTMLGFLMWLVLLFLCWPLALLALVLYPLIWLILLPFRLLGIGVDAVFELLRAIVMLPARVLGGRR
jgi:hypothetical protein